MNRSKAENRYNSYIKALRKQRIARDIYFGDVDYYDNLHQYSKNKIHCSCPLCSAKTNNKQLIGKTVNYKISDLRKIDHLNNSQEEFKIP